MAGYERVFRCRRVDALLITDIDSPPSRHRNGRPRPVRSVTMNAEPSGDAEICASCGVSACDAIFDRCLAREFEDPDFFAVHHLSVAAYELQHGEVTADAADALRQLILTHLNDPPTSHSVQRIRDQFDGGQPVKEQAHPPPAAAPAAESIASVDFSSAETYCASVRRWANSVARNR